MSVSLPPSAAWPPAASRAETVAVAWPQRDGADQNAPALGFPQASQLESIGILSPSAYSHATVTELLNRFVDALFGPSP